MHFQTLSLRFSLVFHPTLFPPGCNRISAPARDPCVHLNVSCILSSCTHGTRTKTYAAILSFTGRQIAFFFFGGEKKPGVNNESLRELQRIKPKPSGLWLSGKTNKKTIFYPIPESKNKKKSVFEKKAGCGKCIEGWGEFWGQWLCNWNCENPPNFPSLFKTLFLHVFFSAVFCLRVSNAPRGKRSSEPTAIFKTFISSLIANEKYMSIIFLNTAG